MNKLNLSLENCFGIRKLVHTFDFTKTNAFAIYAPNGSMKTSFAETFKTVAEGGKPRDRMFPKRVSSCIITDEAGSAIPPANILVLPPYDEFFGPTEKTSTLLVNSGLRKEFELLHAEIDSSKKAFVDRMKAQSGSKKDLGAEIALTFTSRDDDEAFYLALDRVRNEVKDQKDAPFAEITYDTIFEEKVLKLVQSPEGKAAIKDYITRYNELLAGSTYFQKGTFEYFNGSQIAKALEDNGFFTAKHTITLNASEKLEIQTREQLEAIINGEVDKLTKDEALKKRFAKLKTLLEKNQNVRAFQNYLTTHELLLPHLANMELFKQNIWKSYFKTHEAAFNELLEKFAKVKERRSQIEDEARKEQTQWEDAIALFNERFFVPFKLEAKNKIGVALGREAMLDLAYTFEESGESTPVQKADLLKVLSQGERRALYILNIIFEIQVRRHAQHETLFIVDDIADSFDYKNKYAIIQYLSDISEGPAFKLIILTHNFDFFRTLESRFINYSNCLMASKSKSEIVVGKAFGIRNIFVKDWKTQFYADPKKRIACIPFMRNLIEYTRGETDPEFLRLTSLLHWKADSASITQADLDRMYANLFAGSAEAHNKPTESVVDAIMNEAQKCLGATAGANFENKIVLAIATRHAAEKFMIAKIADAAFVAGIHGNQTALLFKRFQQTQYDAHAVKVLGGVVLMTPENIHLNAFMYEPILDMSDDRLRSLFSEVLKLK